MDNKEKDDLELNKQGSNYGTITSTPSPKRVIFCVHGKPSAGCCTVSSEGDFESPFHSIIASPFESTKEKNHCHRSRNEETDKKARRKLIIASILCVVFMIAEIVGGYLSSSLAIATDAAHLMTDFASFMISLFSLWMAGRPPTRKMSFGWYRAEVIGALTSVLLIWVVTGILVYLAVQRVIGQTFEIDATIMLITSAVGIVVNLIMGLTLHQHGHSHGGSNKVHPSDEESKPIVHKKKESNINVQAAFIHVLGDFLQSFGVFVAALIIYFKPSWSIVDPICTFLFSILVVLTTVALIKDTVTVLMEGKPKGIDFTDVMDTFLRIDGVIRVHNLRIWALSLDKTALSAHLAIKPGINPQNVLSVATKNIHEKYDFFEMTLQIEEFENNMEDCSQCKLPAK